MADHLRLPAPRPIASRRAGGGGGASVERVPGPHGRKLKGELAAAASRPRRGTEGVDPAQVYKLRTVGGISEGTLASSELQWLGNTADWTYFVLAEEGPEEFERMLDSYTASGETRTGAKHLSFFEHIEEILPYGPEDRQGQGVSEDDLAEADSLVVDIVIWPSADTPTATARVGRVRALLERDDAEELAVDQRPRYTVVRARAGSECIRNLLELSVVERVRTPPVPYLEPTTWRFATEEDLPDPDRIDGVPIGLIDDEVMDHPLLEPSIGTREALPAGHGWSPPSDHGTLVAGLLVFGDIEACLAEDADWEGLGPVHCMRVLEENPNVTGDAIFPTDAPVHQVIEEAIRTLHDRHGVRIFNLSISDRYSFAGPHLSLWSERMDELARELDAVIVVAAGNHGATNLAAGESILDAYPKYLLEDGCRVAEPGAGANVLTVGALARHDAPQRADGRTVPGDRAIAATGEPAPFTRSGPGAAGGIKPDVVHYGGNWVMNDVDMVETRDHGVSGVSTLVSGGRFYGLANGTSYAAPRVTRVAAQILNRYPGASANLIRALIGSAVQPIASPDTLDAKELRKLGGYGLLSDDYALESGRSRVALIYEGEIDPDTAVIHPVPVPNEFIEARGSRRIVVALAFDPEVRRTRREYLTANMKFDLVRGLAADQIESRWQRQPTAAADRLDLPSGRARPGLDPGANECKDATLQVRSYTRTQVDKTDAHGYHVVVQHLSASWFPTESPQRYALVVALEDREREGVDLRALAEARLEPRVRVRV
jgi:hypothetical protein